MHTILQIYKRDLRRLITQPLTLVLALALGVVGGAYGWICIVVNHDPYGNTGNLKVAVSSEDAGAEISGMGELNLGSQLIESLETNDNMDWQFVDADTAVEGVESGEYYAALVFPEDFSANIASLLTSDAKPSQIEYYVNEKVNAASPRITDSVASTLEQTINEQFASQISGVVAELIANLSDQTTDAIDQSQQDGLAQVDDATAKLQSAIDGLDEASDSLDSAREQVSNAKTSLSDLTDAIDSSQNKLSASTTQLGQLRTTASSTLSSLSSTAAQGGVLLGQAAGGLGLAAGQANAGLQQASGQLDTVIESAQNVSDDYTALLAAIKQSSAADNDTVSALIATLEQQNADYQQAIDSLRTVSGNISTTSSAVSGTVSAGTSAIQSGIDSASDASQTIGSTAIPQLYAGLDSYAQMSTELAVALGSLQQVGEQGEATLDQLDSTLASVSSTLAATAQSLGDAQSDLSAASTDLHALRSSEVYAQLEALSGLDADALADFVASPATLETTTFYAVEDYGSSVAPMYTNLALWVGAFATVLIFRVEPDDEGVDSMTVTTGFLGRWLFFATVALLQSVIIAAGDLVIGVQTTTALGLFATCALISVSYVSIIYALTAAFTHIGRGLCVLLLVLQISGSSGMYPIEMMPEFFQRIYHVLPFTYGIKAIREIVGGMYGMNYVKAIAPMAAIAAVVMALVVALRPWTNHLTEYFNREMLATGLIVGEEFSVAGRGEHRTIRILVGTLAERQEHQRRLRERHQRYMDRYPKMRRAAIVAGVVVPAILAVFSVTSEEKVVMLSLWVVWLLVIMLGFVALEYFHGKFERLLREENDMETTADLGLAWTEGQ
ncbi:ABC transporter [Bifidobacterium lemurum]|uniref:ABC transporter n=1 Tax=Bifidobacterium lemurum TaxID=1603886 RepID=A0A261FTY6_9BIFI|nr:YhgE/Pip domain-containing protein [Bifidobacterium lemurum]OZG62413.1 ABC transporter [Bifidobacterium lemurum]QOL33763.1 YhgE/Pip domain-containing protein [Bifidobacterium lemurum]